MDIVYLIAKAIPLAFTALLPVVNPLGTAVILLGMTEGVEEAGRRALARRIGINTVLLLTVVLVGGSYLLSFFGISVPIVQVAGGLVLAAMGWNLLNQSDVPDSTTTVPPSAGTPTALMERSFYPFTFPITVGPGCVAVTLTLSAHARHDTAAESVAVLAGAVLGIFGIGVVMYFCIVYSRLLAQRLGHSGTKVLLRLIAFIVVCIGAQICWNGIVTLAHELR